jgi:hypothetical protein
MIFSASDGARILELRGHASQLTQVEFSPDGQRLATASRDGTVVLWDAQGGQELLSLTAHRASPAAVAFSPDGSHLAIASNGVLRILDAAPVPVPSNSVPPPSSLQGRQIAEGWRVWFRELEGIEMGLDREVHHGGTNSAFIKANQPGPRYIAASAMQTFAADAYRGQRIRLSAYLKLDQVVGGASLSLRCDSQDKIVAWDNMPTRKMTGTTDWQKCEVVLDVPPDSVSMSAGFMLQSRSGQVWADDFQLEVVDRDVPTTDSGVPMLVAASFTDKNIRPEQTQPVNLDFEK